MSGINTTPKVEKPMNKSNESAPTKKPKAERKTIIIGGALTSLLASVIMFALTLVLSAPVSILEYSLATIYPGKTSQQWLPIQLTI
jgi:hypothetical protein